MPISVKMICDSVNHKNIRLSTLLIIAPRKILAEINTHRAFSRNSSSSRAIPIERFIDTIRKDPVYPLFYGKNQKGMVSGDELENEAKIKVNRVIDELRNFSINSVEILEELGLHKEQSNRFLEPFTYTATLVSATEWNNFLALRTHKDAQPEIQSVARLIKTCLEVHEPVFLEDDEWHLPFIETKHENLTLEDKKIMSVAKCATISYARQDEDITMEKARAIYERLSNSNPIHASPFEHQAKPIADSNEATHLTLSDNELWCGNFRGWMQLRHTIKNNYVPY